MSPVPTEVGLLTSLIELKLGRNRLSGPIPSEIGQLTRLAELLLEYNKLTGLVPGEIGNLQALTYLSLVNNDGLTGDLENTHLCALNELESFGADCATGCTCCTDPNSQPNICQEEPTAVPSS
jgi:Leucine-rich repeat (LRR) protein